MSCCAGRPPFERPSAIATLAAHLSDHVPLGAGLPAGRRSGARGADRAAPRQGPRRAPVRRGRRARRAAAARVRSRVPSAATPPVPGQRRRDLDDPPEVREAAAQGARALLQRDAGRRRRPGQAAHGAACTPRRRWPTRARAARRRSPSLAESVHVLMRAGLRRRDETMPRVAGAADAGAGRRRHPGRDRTSPWAPYSSTGKTTSRWPARAGARC